MHAAPCMQTCGTATAAVDAAYATCVCDDTFVSNFQTCAACMATDLTATNDAANAEIATNAPGGASLSPAHTGSREARLTEIVAAQS